MSHIHARLQNDVVVRLLPACGQELQDLNLTFTIYILLDTQQHSILASLRQPTWASEAHLFSFPSPETLGTPHLPAAAAGAGSDFCLLCSVGLLHCLDLSSARQWESGQAESQNIGGFHLCRVPFSGVSLVLSAIQSLEMYICPEWLLVAVVGARALSVTQPLVWAAVCSLLWWLGGCGLAVGTPCTQPRVWSWEKQDLPVQFPH